MSFLKLVDYDNSSDESDEDDSTNEVLTRNDINIAPNVQNPQPISEISTESESEESVISVKIESDEKPLAYRERAVSESDSSSSDDSDDPEIYCQIVEKHESLEIPKAKGELSVSDLPPIEDLFISVKQEESAVLGTIQSIVEQLVVVQSLPGISAVDIDSVLFLDEGKRALGKVFDIIGPVSAPLYCVRFNSKEHIEQKDVCIGATVYYAPKTEHTSFIFLPDLIKHKGSDASWIDDIEPPEKHLDYSDDEQERAARNAKKRTHEESANSSNHTQDKDQQRKTPTNKNKNKSKGSYQRNHSFPMHPSHAQSNRQQFNNQAFNTRPNIVPNIIYPPFPNIGQPSSVPYQPVFNNYLQGPSNNHMMPQNMWYGSNIIQNPTMHGHFVPYPVPRHPPPPPPGT
ncbi:H/ACA ribonucleoprotein complex non-core subunit NAF1-like [Ctenocephalides felis]|uniref:H/ACA ribonucleoprotein complex non-core subunit NAF1-like n=1 Tax=Ctenocephalides felis TaxID=7515 RepID=UPI000E6E363A|nr:H/ACA ribonucleoprotein complex non-core subunit NAF1-like [Ctenocephalides felis]